MENNLESQQETQSDALSDADIPQSKKELLECIQNFMGVFDTPVSRRAIKGSFADEVRKIGRQILESNNKVVW